ncbi:MAG: hypothetical protein JWP68_25 [Modestobacter sp.]|nr:hypothetical protein [Modestobacter sp.]
MVDVVSDVVVVAALLFAALVVPVGLAVYRRRVDRVVRLAGPGSWATACVDPRTPSAWRVLVLDDVGVHLRRTNGREDRSWPWRSVVRATIGPVRAFAAVVSHQGVCLSLTDGSTVEFLLPSRSTLRYPPDLLQRALQELARHGKS